jgi:hypothetical protein
MSEYGFTSLLEEISHAQQIPDPGDRMKMLQVLANVYRLDIDRVVHLSLLLNSHDNHAESV